MPTPSIEEGQAAAPLHDGTPRAHSTDEIIGCRTPAATHARPVVPRSAHTRPSAGLRAALRGRLQALLGLR